MGTLRPPLCKPVDTVKSENLHKAVSHVRWQLVFVLFLLSATIYLDRVNLSIAGSSFRNEYHLDEVQLGWIVSAFLIGYGLFQAPAGRFVDRFGPRIAVTWAVCWWALFTVLTTAVPRNTWSPLTLLIAIRFLLGAGEAIVYPACSLFTARWIPIPERGRANGLIFAGVGIGAGVAPPLITLSLLHFGWRFSFWACAVFGLILGVVWFISARDNPESHPGLSNLERHLIHLGIDQGGADSVRALKAISGRSAPMRWWQTLDNWNVWAITVTYFCFGYVAWLFFGWFYIYLAEERGVNLRASALYGMLPFIGMVVGSVAGGLLCDQVTKIYSVRTGRCVVSAVAMAVAALLLISGSRISNAASACIVLSIGAGTLYVAQSSFWSVSVGLGGRSSGLVSGIMNMGAQAGGAMTASLTPWLAMHFGWNTSFSVAGAIALLGAVLWLSVNPDSRLGANRQSSRNCDGPGLES